MVQGGPRFCAKSWGGGSDILHTNSRGKTDFERHLTHKLVLNKFSKSLKRSCSTYKDFIPYIHLFHFVVCQRLCTTILGGHIFCTKILGVTYVTNQKRKINHKLLPQLELLTARLPVILGQFPVTLLSQKRLSRR